MKANQKMIGNNGLQNALFPLEYLYITQGEHDSGLRYVMDFSGWGASGKVNRCPLYAPCDIKCVAVVGTTVAWESINKVNFIDGTIDIMTISVTHDNDAPSFTVGETRNQGEIFSHTGTYGEVTGDHTHMVVGKGKYQGYYTPSGASGSTLKNQYHMYNALGVNDTILVRPLSYPWKDFEKVITTTKSWIPLAIVKAMVNNL